MVTLTTEHNHKHAVTTAVTYTKHVIWKTQNRTFTN